jgi:flagellar assembly protein FliH
MPLIKAQNAPATTQPFSMRDIENQARGILARARQQAEALLADAQREAEALKRTAAQAGAADGRREGLAAGLDQGRRSGHEQALSEFNQQFAQAVGAMTAAAAQVDGSRRQLEANALGEVIELAMAIARRVTKRQGMIDPAVLSANLAEAMNVVSHAADLRIAVHPDQKATMEAELPGLKLKWPHLEHVELTEDPQLSPGGCRIFTAHGMVDADLDTQLDRIATDLLPAKSA